MKNTFTWVLIGAGVIAVYLYWKARAAIGLNWTLENVSPSLQGLATVLNVDMLVTNNSTSSVSLSSINATLYYQGSALAQGGGSATLQPGVNTVTIPFTVSDLTIIGDVVGALSSSPASYLFQIKGTGLVQGVPVSFATAYNIPSSLGSVNGRQATKKQIQVWK